jgi:putative addiction module component (TIGR02574 family)
MAATLEQIEAEAMQLSLEERGELVHRLIVSLDGEPEDSPEDVAKAWEAEIERRIDDLEAGRTHLIRADEVIREARARIKSWRP